MIDARTEELRDTQTQLVRQERLAMLGQLAGSVAHKLHNPLGTIRSTTYFLDMALQTSEPEVKESLAILENEVMTSERIISGLLEFANPEPALRRKKGLAWG